MFGPTGAGKSAVINTITSVLRNELTHIAFSCADEVVVTKKFRTYRLRESTSHPAIPVMLCDTMGIPLHDYKGNTFPSKHDMCNIMDGHIKDHYLFHGSARDRSQYFSNHPSLMDKVHAVMLVIDGFYVSDNMQDKRLQSIIREAQERHIQVGIIVTKIDSLCSRVDHDVSVVFSSPDWEKVVEDILCTCAIPSCNIFPMRNYTYHMQLSLPINILALRTLEKMLKLADKTLDHLAASENMFYRQVESDTDGGPADECVPSKINASSKRALLNIPWIPYVRLTREYVGNIFSTSDHYKQKKICYMGLSGSGKSSFINSALSTFAQNYSDQQKHVMKNAMMGRGDDPVTKHYQEYSLSYEAYESRRLVIKLVDTMGLSAADNGLLTDDISTVLDGHVTDMAAFSPFMPLPKYDAPRTFPDCMHVLVLVVNGAMFDKYPPELIHQMKQVMDIAECNPRKIPRMVLVTHIDSVCEHVAGNPIMMYRSQLVKECVENIHEQLEIPLEDIWPVVNYCNDTEIDSRKETLILNALNHQMQLAEKSWQRGVGSECWERELARRKRDALTAQTLVKRS